MVPANSQKNSKPADHFVPKTSMANSFINDLVSLLLYPL